MPRSSPFRHHRFACEISLWAARSYLRIPPDRPVEPNPFRCVGPSPLHMADTKVTLPQFTRAAGARRVLHACFLKWFNETCALQGIRQADSRVLSDAVVPREPSQPRKNGFLTARELEQFTGSTVPGQIPTRPAGSRRKEINCLAAARAAAREVGLRRRGHINDAPGRMPRTRAVPECLGARTSDLRYFRWLRTAPAHDLSAVSPVATV